MNKLIRDGNVAVLVAGGYGAGWSTWAREFGEQMMFDPNVVEAVECGDVPLEDILEYLEETYPAEHFSGYGQLEVVWVPEGSRFRIEEYDGSEGLVLEKDYYWITA